MPKCIIEYDGGAFSVTIPGNRATAVAAFWARRDLPTLASPGEGRQISSVTLVTR